VSVRVCVCVCDVVGWQFACGYAQISLLSALKSNAKGQGQTIWSQVQ